MCWNLYSIFICTCTWITPRYIAILLNLSFFYLSSHISPELAIEKKWKYTSQIICAWYLINPNVGCCQLHINLEHQFSYDKKMTHDRNKPINRLFYIEIALSPWQRYLPVSKYYSKIIPHAREWDSQLIFRMRKFKKWAHSLYWQIILNTVFFLATSPLNCRSRKK